MFFLSHLAQVFRWTLLPCLICFVFGTRHGGAQISIQRLQGSEYPVDTRYTEGCQFGRRHYNLGQTWNPELPPFGVMRCVTCSCNKVPRRPGKMGKVACYGTRDRCPKTSCAHPRTLSNQCCPSCPDEYVALLGPKTRSASSTPVSLGVGRIHVILGTKSLRISVLYEGQQKLKDVVFVGPQDQKLKEINVPRRATNGTKTCLIRHRVDNRTISLIKEGRVTALFKFKSRAVDELQGVLEPWLLYSEETFEAMLHPTSSAPPRVSNAGAIASLTLTPSGKTVMIYMQYSGFPINEQVKIRFQKISNQGKTGRFVKKLKAKFNTTTKAGHVTLSWSKPKEHELRWLARGSLGISLVIGSSTTAQLRGRIEIKQLCNTLFATLSGRTAPRPTVTGSSGYAAVSVDNKGRLYYKVSLSGLTQVAFEINMEATRRRHLIKRLNPRELVPNKQGRAEVSGVWERPSASVIYWLFGGELFINVRTALYRKGEIRGQVRQLPYGGHHVSYQEPPVVLAGNEVVPSTQTGAGGQAWFTMDKNCALHYHIMLSGLERGNKNKITADLQGFADYGKVPLSYEKKKRRLTSFYGETLSGTVRDLTPEFQFNLARGLVYLQVSSEDSPEGELRAQVSLNNDRCGSRPTTSPPLKTLARGSCLFEGRQYSIGETWRPDYDQTCTTCSCKNSRVQCIPIKCKKITCQEAPVVLPHSCCPVCPVKEENAVQIIDDRNPATEGCYFESDKKVYPSGAVWHPFVMPFGYMKCIVCSCLPNVYQIKCSKVTCPKLTCSKRRRLDPSDCCERCDDPSPVKPKARKSCRFGSSTYANGARWTPSLPPFGVIRCIVCSCKDGKSSCGRVECPKNQCKKPNSLQDDCCQPCPGS